MGGVLQDKHGHFKGASAKLMYAIVSVKHVELNAIKEGMLMLQMLQIDNTAIETDCLKAIACNNDV